jgi:hypothetical protein
MREVGAFEAKNKLCQLLDLVERGETSNTPIAVVSQSLPGLSASSIFSSVISVRRSRQPGRQFGFGRQMRQDGVQPLIDAMDQRHQARQRRLDAPEPVLGVRLAHSAASATS